MRDGILYSRIEGNIDPMTDVLIRIKRAVLTGNYRFSEKALIEMDCERLLELDIVESISTAVAV